MKFCHRAYLTPIIRHRKRLAPDPYYSLSSQGSVGAFSHVVWECPWVLEFWEKVIHILTGLMGVVLPVENARKVWQASLTTAKRIVVQRWKPPHDISSTHWLRSFLDILFLELSSARINNVGTKTVLIWPNLLLDLKDLRSRNDLCVNTDS